MAGTLAKRIVVPDVPAVAMAKGFKGYKTESERIVRKVEVTEDETLKQLKAAWKSLQYKRCSPEQIYENALATVEGLEYSASDVEGFSLALGEYDQNEKDFSFGAGLFLSALVNNGKDTDYIVHTKHLERPLSMIGYSNTKNITVRGDAGHYVGNIMEGGTIIVEKDAGCWVGEWMHGGSITVKGNADKGTGSKMHDGTITVEGYAAAWVGSEMTGGEIHLEGTFTNLGGDIRGGRIFFKGELIFDRS